MKMVTTELLEQQVITESNDDGVQYDDAAVIKFWVQEIEDAGNHWWADRALRMVEEKMSNTALSNNVRSVLLNRLRQQRLRSAIDSMQKYYRHLTATCGSSPLEGDGRRGMWQRVDMVDKRDIPQMTALLLSVLEDEDLQEKPSKRLTLRHP